MGSFRMAICLLLLGLPILLLKIPLVLHEYTFLFRLHTTLYGGFHFYHRPRCVQMSYVLLFRWCRVTSTEDALLLRFDFCKRKVRYMAKMMNKRTTLTQSNVFGEETTPSQVAHHIP